MITGEQRRQMYAMTYPNVVKSRQTPEERKRIETHNKRTVDRILKANWDNREDRIRKAKQKTEDAIRQVAKHLDNKPVSNREEAERKVSELLD